MQVNPYFDELSDHEIQTKTCRRCGDTKHKSFFAYRSYNKNGDAEYKNYCIECSKKAYKQVAKIKKSVGPIPYDHRCDCCKRNEKEILKAYRLFQGIKKTVWTYDHDHQTGKFRGIICQPCNSIMGNLQDNISIAKKVLIYTRKIND